MDFKQYNRKVMDHLMGLLEASEMDHWNMIFDPAHLDPQQGLHKYAQPDGMLVLNFNPMACREFHLGEEHITCNMSLRGHKTHLVLPFYAVRGIQLEIQGVPIVVPADMAVLIIDQGVAPDQERRAEPEPMPLTGVAGKIVPLFGNRNPSSTKES